VLTLRGKNVLRKETMTQYMGGKGRQGREIAHILSTLDPAGSHQSPYWEPFVGMCGVMRHMRAPVRYGSDIHTDVIAMWRALQSGWVPPSQCSRKQFEKLKQDAKQDPALRAFIGHAMSFKGVYFGSYYEKGSDCARAQRKVMDCVPLIRDVKFFPASYEAVKMPQSPSFLIYCDPPYDDGTNRKIGKKAHFDSKQFWKWARKQSENHMVVVSEKTAPADFVPVWQSKDNIPHYLFVHKSNL